MKRFAAHGTCGTVESCDTHRPDVWIFFFEMREAILQRTCGCSLWWNYWLSLRVYQQYLLCIIINVVSLPFVFLAQRMAQTQTQYRSICVTRRQLVFFWTTASETLCMLDSHRSSQNIWHSLCYILNQTVCTIFPAYILGKLHRNRVSMLRWCIWAVLVFIHAYQPFQPRRDLR